MEDATEKVKGIVKARMLYDLGYQLLDNMEERQYEQAQGTLNELQDLAITLEKTLDNLRKNIP